MLLQLGPSKEYIKQYLNTRMKNYDKSYNEKVDLFKECNINIKNSTILDLAAGPGVDEDMFIKLGANNVFYHDKYQEYIKTAQKVNKVNLNKITFTQAELDNIDYIKDGSIDLIWCNGAFSYSQNDSKLFLKMIQKIKKGGHIFIATKDKKILNEYNIFKKIIIYPFYYFYKITNYKLFTLGFTNFEKIDKLAKENSLKEIKRENIHNYGYKIVWQKIS